jgi:hypothetical protein
VGCKIAVTVYHALTEAFVRASDSESALAVSVPVGKQPLEMLFIPGKEKFREFMVVDCISIRRICDPNITQRIHVSSIFTYS